MLGRQSIATAAAKTQFLSLGQLCDMILSQCTSLGKLEVYVYVAGSFIKSED
jgi:hypothetical protein